MQWEASVMPRIDVSLVMAHVTPQMQVRLCSQYEAKFGITCEGSTSVVDQAYPAYYEGQRRAGARRVVITFLVGGLVYSCVAILISDSRSGQRSVRERPEVRLRK